MEICLVCEKLPHQKLTAANNWHMNTSICLFAGKNNRTKGMKVKAVMRMEQS